MTYYFILLFFVLDYVRPGNLIPGFNILHLNAIVPAAAILGTLMSKTPVSNREFLEDMNSKLMGTFLGLLVVSTLLATVTMYAYDVTYAVFSYMLVYWVLARNVGDSRRLKGVLLTLIGVHLVIAALNPALFTDPDNRVGINSGAFLGDGNDFALSVNICIPLCLFLMMESKRKIAKVAYAGALLMLFFCVVATKSRGGTLALGAVLMYFWLKSNRKVLTASVFVLVVAATLAAAPRSYFVRMNSIADTQEGSAQGRIQAWQAGIRMALRSPLLGAGAGHFPMAYGSEKESRWMTAHSIYFLMLGELGFPGIAILLTLIFWNLAANRRALRALRELPPDQASSARNVLNCTSAALVAFATGGAFLSAAYYPHLYVLCGLMVAARHIARVQVEAHAHAGQGLSSADARLQALLPLRPGQISPEWMPRPALGTNRLDRHPASSIN